MHGHHLMCAAQDNLIMCTTVVGANAANAAVVIARKSWLAGTPDLQSPVKLWTFSAALGPTELGPQGKPHADMASSTVSSSRIMDLPYRILCLYVCLYASMLTMY